ncbi:MAG: Lpp/OprI family alanine-zipper lipoprotein [Proteobacteria bacterium]|nr:Lpp/OprI family alanine-zipper lipoprotein [Pseudomonadota bacterium]
MKKFIKISMIALAASLVVGCATNSDIENLQTQLDGLKTSVAQASSDAASAAQAAQDTNSKLDNMFKKSMMK